MARRVETIGIDIEQKPSQNNRRVSTLGLEVEQRLTNNNRRVSTLGLLLEQKRYPHYRQITTLGLMVEWEPAPERYISGVSHGTSTASGTLVGKTEIYELTPGLVEITGNLYGNGNVYSITTNEALIQNSVLYGEVLISGRINSIPLTHSYLFDKAKNNLMAIGITNVSGVLKGYINLYGNSFEGTELPGTLVGIGFVIGLLNGKTIINMNLSGLVTVTGGIGGTSQIRGISLEFAQTDISVDIQENPY